MREFLPLPDTVETLVRDGDGLTIRPAPRPAPGERDLVFRLLAAGVGPAELDPARRHPDRPVAAAVGEIAAAGERAGGWEPLERAVILWPEESPGAPPAGNWLTVPAGWGRRGLLRKLPLEMRPDAALLLPAVGHAGRLLRECALREGASLGVVGLGLTGQIAVVLARHERAHPILVIDPSPTLRRRAVWGGAARALVPGRESLVAAALEATGGGGLDAVLILGGDRLAVEEGAASLAPGGRLVVGEAGPRAGTLPVDLARLVAGEMRLIGAGRPDPGGLRGAFRTLREGLLDPDTLVSKRYAWNELAGIRWDPETWCHALYAVIEGPEEPRDERPDS